MIRKKLKLIITSLAFIGAVFVGSSTANADNVSGTNSTATVQFYGKTNGSNNSSTGDSSVRNDVLPQTGDFVVPNITLYGYALITVGISWILISRKRNNED